MKHVPKRWWDIWNALALMAALIVVTTRLVSTNWTHNLSVITYLTIMAVILGFALGISRFSGWVATLMSLAYGLFGIPWLLGLELSPGIEWQARLVSMAERLQAATSLFLAKKPVYDPILFLLLMSILFFILSVSAGYSLMRKGNSWLAVLPTGLALLVINHYDRFANNGLRYVGLYALLALIIIGRSALLHRRSEWQRQGVFYAPETSGDLNRVTLLLIAGLLIFSWSVPVISTSSSGFSDFWTNMVSRPWTSLTSRISDAFSSLQTRVVVVQSYFGENMSLTSGSYLSDNVLFTVNAAAPPPSGNRFYWQARTYDTYKDGSWSATNYQAKSFNTITFNINYPNYKDRQPIEFTFTSKINQQNVPTAPMPVWTSLPVQALLTTTQNGTQDSLGLIASSLLTVGQVYRERSLISIPTVADLQAASTDYPAYITGTYLEIPANIEPKFKQLALQITAGAATPYDKAQAITLWLRNNITYKAVIDTPPTNQDPIEWFLFDYKQGFCDYYASAEVLLLRSIGIPARFVGGYAEGTYDVLSNMYTVHQNDAHAWPEVYFPDLGWVIFEPTVSQPPITLPQGGSGSQGVILTPTPNVAIQGPIEGATPNPQGNIEVANQTQTSGPTIYQIIMISGGLLALAGLIFFFLKTVRPRLEEIPLPVRMEKALEKRHLPVPRWLHRWSQRVSLTPFEKIFVSLGRTLRLFGKQILPAQTPAERVEILVETLPETGYHANIVLAEYERAEYSPYPANLTRAALAAVRVRQLAFRAFFKRLFNWLHK